MRKAWLYKHLYTPLQELTGNKQVLLDNIDVPFLEHIMQLFFVNKGF